MIGHPQTSAVVAWKEILEHIRTKRIFLIGAFLAVTFFLIGWGGAEVSREFQFILEDDLRAPFVIAFYFGLFGLVSGYTFISVLAIVLSGDAVVAEWKDRTLFLLLSKPVSRYAVLAGKFIGAYLSVMLVFTTVFGLGLIFVLAMVGPPSAEGWLRILKWYGIIALGLVPFVSLGIFCSTLFRSPVTSFVSAFSMTILGFFLIGILGEIILFIQRKPDEITTSDMVDFFHYLDPMNLLQSANRVLLPESDQIDFLSSPFGAPDDIPMVLLGMALHSALWLGLSFLIIGKRDYA